MNKLAFVVVALSTFAMVAGSAFGLDIQLSPQTLVLSSGGDQLTIHTNLTYCREDLVVLDIGDNCGVGISKWADDCGDLVVRCSKEAVRQAVGEFEDRFTTVEVTLTVIHAEEFEHSATEVLRVRK